jgi:hypothetical protein
MILSDEMGLVHRLFVSPILNHSNRLAQHLPTAVGSIGQGKRRTLLRHPHCLIKTRSSSKECK